MMSDDAAPSTGQEANTAFFDALVAQFAHRRPRLYREEKKPVARWRLTAIEKLVWWRHGGPVDTDEGEIYFDAALPYLAAIGRKHARPILPVDWAHRVVPRFYKEKGRSWFIGQERIAGRGAFPSADEFGQQLAVTAAEIQLHTMLSVGAVDRPKHVRLAERKDKDRERKRLARLAAGMTPRATSLVAVKPWKAVGMERSAWYAAGKPVAAVRLPSRTDLSASTRGGEDVRTKSSRDGLTNETTTTKPWMIEGISRATWFRKKAAAADVVVMPDPSPVVVDDEDLAPGIVLEVGRVRLDAVQLAAWQEEFPGVHVVTVLAAEAGWMNRDDNAHEDWREMAELMLSLEHHKLMQPANDDEMVAKTG